MNTIDMDSLVDLIFNLRWKSETACHTDCYQANGVNIWRDYFPPGLVDALLSKEPGERIELSLEAGTAGPGYDPSKIFTLRVTQFDTGTGPRELIRPRIGRF